MFTLKSWNETQGALLSDPAYVGMTPGGEADSVAIWWKVDGVRTERARHAIEVLIQDGVHVTQRVGRASLARILAEADRMIGTRPGGVRVFEAGPNPDETGADVTVADGSFEEAAKSGTDVIAQLDPKVPVIINEGEQPIPAS